MGKHFQVRTYSPHFNTYGGGARTFTTRTSAYFHLGGFGYSGFGYKGLIGRNYFLNQPVIYAPPTVIVPVIAAPPPAQGLTVTPNPQGQQLPQLDFMSAVYIQEIGKALDAKYPFPRIRLGNDFQIYSIGEAGESALFVSGHQHAIGTGRGALIELQNRLAVSNPRAVVQELQTPEGRNSFAAATQVRNAQLYRDPNSIPYQIPVQPIAAQPQPAATPAPAVVAPAQPAPTELAKPIAPVQIAPAPVPLDKVRHQDFKERTSKVEKGLVNFANREIQIGNVNFVVTPGIAMRDGKQETIYRVDIKTTKGYENQASFSKKEYDAISKNLETDQDALSKAIHNKRHYNDLKAIAATDAPKPYVTDPNAALAQGISLPSTGVPVSPTGADDKKVNVADASIQKSKPRVTGLGFTG